MRGLDTGSRRAATGGRSLVRAQTARESGRVQTARAAGRQRGGGGLSPSRSPPRGRTSPRKKEVLHPTTNGAPAGT
eukprot:2333364-Rhodomonas_salina.2